MSTSVWLFKPRSHGRKREGARARNGPPLPGRLPMEMTPFSLILNTEGFRPCLSKPSYRAPKWALMVRLMQKKRLESPQKSLIIENQAF